MLKHPKTVIGIVVLITLFFGIAAVSIVFDNNIRIFFPEDNPSKVNFDELEDLYGSQVMMDICITTEENSLFTWESLDMIETLVADIEDLDYVDNVMALTNTDYPEGTDEGMAVSKLLPEGEERTEANLKKFKERLLDWSDAYGRALYSNDYRSTQIIINIDKEAETDDIGILLKEARALIAPYENYPYTFRIAGTPVVTQTGKDYMYADLAVLVPFVFLVLLLCLYLAFKRFSSALLPMITVLTATIWTVGTMSLFGATFTLVSSCLPVLIIAVGSAYGIHIINHYYHIRAERKDGDVTGNLKEAVKEVFLPILLAGATTVVGFASIVTSPVVPMKMFGIFAAVGTAYSLLLAFFFIPALLELAEKRKNKKKDSDAVEEEEYSTSPAFLKIISLSVKHKAPTTIVVIILLGLSIWGLTTVNVESAMIEHFPGKEPIRQDSRYIDENFGGTNTFSVNFIAGEGYDMTNPAALKAMDDLKQHLLSKYPDVVGNIIAYSDYIKRMNQIMNYPVVESDEAEEVYTGDYDAADDSFFGSGPETGMDSFFGAEDDTGMDSFFGADDTLDETGMESFFDDSFAAAEEAPAGEVTAEFISLNREMTVQDLIVMINDSYTEGDVFNLSMNDINDKLKEMTNYRGAAYYEIPWDLDKYPVAEQEELKNLIAQYLLLYSGSLDDYANDSLKPTEARMAVQLKTHGSTETDMIIKDIETFADRNLPEGFSVECAGTAEMELALTNLITNSQLTSLLVALVAVFLIISVSYKSPLAGLIGIIPLSLSILMNFGLMGLMGINLDMITALIASMAIGIGVDYTVHFFSRYRRERAKTDDLALVTRNTVLSTGRGILINAMSVGLGFAVLCFSRFLVLRYIGILVAIIMVSSSMGALIILPLVLNKLDPKFMQRRETESAVVGKKRIRA